MHKLLVALLLVATSLSLNAGWFSDDPYKIIDDETKRDIKRTVLVELRAEISREELTKLAQKIKRENVLDYKSTYISYYIKGKRDDGYWAITNFEPTLKINILDEEDPVPAAKAIEKVANPEKLSYSFCYAMQAYTQCSGINMSLDTESKIDKKLNTDVRGRKSPYKESCTAGFYQAMEDQNKKEFCNNLIKNYGCDGKIEPKLIQQSGNVCPY